MLVEEGRHEPVDPIIPEPVPGALEDVERRIRAGRLERIAQQFALCQRHDVVLVPVADQERRGRLIRIIDGAGLLQEFLLPRQPARQGRQRTRDGSFLSFSASSIIFTR